MKYIYIILNILFVSLTVYSQNFKDDSKDSNEIKRNIKYSVNDVDFKYTKTETINNSLLKEIIVLPYRNSFRPEDLELDRQRIKKYYFDNGYFNADIDTSVTYDNEDESVDVLFIISENVHYRYGNILYKNLDSLPEKIKQEVYKEPVIKRGDFYSKTGVLGEVTRVINVLQENGYPFARQDTSYGTVVEKYTNDTRVNIELAFLDVDKQYNIGKTRVQINNDKYGFDPDLVRRQITYKEGDLYRKDLLQQSERNFSKIAIIQSGRIQIDRTREDRNIVDLVAYITLGDKYEITPNIEGVQIQNEFYVGAGLEYIDNNFFGGGRTLLLQLQGLAHSNDANRIEFSATMYQPYFIRNSMTALYNIRTGFYNINKIKQYFSIRNLFRTNYFIADYTFYNNAYSDITLDLLRTKYKEDGIKKDTRTLDSVFVPKGTIDNSMNSIIGLTLVHDNTNDLYNPSRGFVHSITVEDAGLLPRIMDLLSKKIEYAQYVKIYIPNKAFFDISGGRTISIIASKLNLGDIIEYGSGEHIVPVQDLYRFFSGGSSSLRGWGAKTNGMLTDPTEGGLFLIDGSLEYRWKTFYGNSSFLKNLQTAYFFDYGSVWESHKVFRFSDMSMAIGLGIRYNTFVGPIRIDVGWKLFDPRAKEGEKWLFSVPEQIFKNKLAIQFGLGQAF